MVDALCDPAVGVAQRVIPNLPIRLGQLGIAELLDHPIRLASERAGHEAANHLRLARREQVGEDLAELNAMAEDPEELVAVRPVERDQPIVQVERAHRRAV